MIKDVEKIAGLFKEKKIGNYNLETKEWWESLKKTASASCEKVETILSKYKEKANKLNE